MSPQPKQEDKSAKRKLIDAIADRLGVAMGMRPPLLERLFGGHGAFALACAWLVLHSILAALVLWSIRGNLADDGHPKLIGLILWGSVFFFAIIMISGVMTKRVLDIVERDIIAFASDDFAAAVAEELKNQSFLLVRFGPVALTSVAWIGGVGALCADIGAETVWPVPSPDMLLWMGCSFYLYFTATRAMAATTFVFCFSGAIEQEREFLFPFGAVESPLVQGLARLNRNLLAYWAMIFAAAATILVLVWPFGLFDGNSRYLFILVPTVAGFSLGLSSTIYLRSQDIIRTTLRRHTFRRAELLQREINDLLNGPMCKNEATAARIGPLICLHDRILAGGRYQSSIGTAVSLALPLVPVIGLVANLFR